MKKKRNKGRPEKIGKATDKRGRQDHSVVPNSTPDDTDSFLAAWASDKPLMSASQQGCPIDTLTQSDWKGFTGETKRLVAIADKLYVTCLRSLGNIYDVENLQELKQVQPDPESLELGEKKGRSVSRKRSKNNKGTMKGRRKHQSARTQNNVTRHPPTPRTWSSVDVSWIGIAMHNSSKSGSNPRTTSGRMKRRKSKHKKQKVKTYETNADDEATSFKMKAVSSAFNPVKLVDKTSPKTNKHVKENLTKRPNTSQGHGHSPVSSALRTAQFVSPYTEPLVSPYPDAYRVPWPPKLSQQYRANAHSKLSYFNTGERNFPKKKRKKKDFSLEQEFVQQMLAFYRHKSMEDKGTDTSLDEKENLIFSKETKIITDHSSDTTLVKSDTNYEKHPNGIRGEEKPMRYKMDYGAETFQADENLLTKISTHDVHLESSETDQDETNKSKDTQFRENTYKVEYKHDILEGSIMLQDKEVEFISPKIVIDLAKSATTQVTIESQPKKEIKYEQNTSQVETAEGIESKHKVIEDSVISLEEEMNFISPMIIVDLATSRTNQYDVTEPRGLNEEDADQKTGEVGDNMVAKTDEKDNQEESVKSDEISRETTSSESVEGIRSKQELRGTREQLQENKSFTEDTDHQQIISGMENKTEPAEDENYETEESLQPDMDIRTKFSSIDANTESSGTVQEDGIIMSGVKEIEQPVAEEAAHKFDKNQHDLDYNKEKLQTANEVENTEIDVQSSKTSTTEKLESDQEIVSEEKIAIEMESSSAEETAGRLESASKEAKETEEDEEEEEEEEEEAASNEDIASEGESTSGETATSEWETASETASETETHEETSEQSSTEEIIDKEIVQPVKPDDDVHTSKTETEEESVEGETETGSEFETDESLESASEEGSSYETETDES